MHERLLRALRTSIYTLIGRAVLHVVDSAPGCQTLQVQVLADETQDGVEHVEPYGFTSSPLPGAEGVVLNVGGRRGSAVGFNFGNRGFRVVGLKSGEVCIYTDEGDKITLKRGRNMEIETLHLAITAQEDATVTTKTYTVIASEGVLARIRTLPSGGAAQDYVTWALSVAGVTRAWCYPGEMGRGSVTVRFAMDATYDNGIPLAADVARVKAYIDSVRPVTADVYVVAPMPVQINCNLRISPDTPRLRVLVAEALWASLRRDATPGGTVIVSRLNEAISQTDGEDDHTLITPAANIQLTTGQLAVPGAINWED